MPTHRLEQELNELIQSDPNIFKFVETSSLDGLWYWDLDAPEHEWMSPKFWTTLGYDPSTKQHLASEWQDIINHDDLAVAVENFQKHCADAEHAYDQVVRYRHQNGSTVWIRCRGLAIRDETGKPMRMIGAHNDITALKQAELDTQRMMKTRERFFARMSHEIRTPLHGMIGIAEVLQNGDVTQEAKAQLETMLQCGKQLQHLLNDLLTLSKIDENKFTISVEDVSLGGVLRYVEALFTPQAANKGLLMVFPEKNVDNLIVKTDHVRLTQILSNLVSNAIKYTFQGAVKIGVVKHEKHLDVVIQDTGDGIEDIDAALKAYHQEVAKNEVVLQGTGLGLEIVHKLCLALAHPLDIQSTMGIGTIVTVRLPLSDVVRPAASAIPVKPQMTAEHKRPIASLLIVDDNEINRDIAQHMLHDVVTHIDMAENGKVAVEKTIERGGYDVILMDLNMPVKDGYQAAREINALPAPYPKSRIIALSADAFDEVVVRCEKVGIMQRVTKPFSKEQLLDALFDLVEND